MVYQGHETTNRYSREVPLGVSNLIGSDDDPVQTYAMSKTDIANMRRWHDQAAIRARNGDAAGTRNPSHQKQPVRADEICPLVTFKSQLRSSLKNRPSCSKVI